MAIPASHIVEVLPRIISGGSSGLELNGLLFTQNALVSASTMVLSFTSAASVGAYFGIGSGEHLAADVYFTGYTNKLTAPKAFFVARRIATDVPAWLRGGKLTHSLAQLGLVTDGAMTISIDNTAYNLTGIDLSDVQSYSGIAQKINEAFAELAVNAKASHSSLTGAITITSLSSGAASEVSFAGPPASGSDLAKLLNLTAESGSVISAGLNALSVAEQMEAVLSRTQNFVCFTTAWEDETEAMLEWAAWANKHFGWLYVAHTAKAAVALADSGADSASALQNSGYDHTAIIYGAMEHAVFIMGVAASIAWQRVNGAVTAAYKSQAGLEPKVVDEGTAAILEAKNCNYFGRFATRNADFVFLYPGCLSASAYGFIDPYLNSVWLNNRLQVALMDGISQSGRVPYNQRGYTMIAAWLMQPVNEARHNAVIEPGVVLSERQKSEIMNEAGLDISGELWTQGYYIQVLDPGPAIRAKRESPLVSLWYTYGGAVQKINVASTVLL